jgi:hypothetical protein
MNLITQLKSSELPALLEPLAGGFYMGQVQKDGQRLAIIKAPNSAGTFKGVFGKPGVSNPGARSFVDGLANSDAIAAAGSKVAQEIRALRVGDSTEWHIPARDVAEVCYRNAKPTKEENWCTFRDGDNPSSVPPGYPYTKDSPAQCTNPLFQEGGAEAFEDVIYLTSTESSAGYAWCQYFDYGGQNGGRKVSERRAFAVRLVPIVD